MSKLVSHYIEDTLPEDNRPVLIASVHPASQESVDLVTSADKESLDGRSQYMWIRLCNGDLILGVFPQGDTYLAVEKDAQFPGETADVPRPNARQRPKDYTLAPARPGREPRGKSKQSNATVRVSTSVPIGVYDRLVEKAVEEKCGVDELVSFMIGSALYSPRPGQPGDDLKLAAFANKGPRITAADFRQPGVSVVREGEPPLVRQIMDDARAKIEKVTGLTNVTLRLKVKA